MATEKLHAWFGEPAHEIKEKLLDRSVHDKHVDESGKCWTVKSEGFWEDEGAGEMRIVITVDDGGPLSSMFPEAYSDVMRVQDPKPAP